MLNRLKDVFASFQKHKVKYIVIGGIASVLYGVPRATFDLDILIDATPENTQRLLDALLEAGIGTASLTNVEEILSNEITIFKDRVRIDVQTSTPGLSFKDGWTHRNTLEYQGQSFWLILMMCACWNFQIKKMPDNICVPRSKKMPADKGRYLSEYKRFRG